MAGLHRPPAAAGAAWIREQIRSQGEVPPPNQQTQTAAIDGARLKAELATTARSVQRECPRGQHHLEDSTPGRLATDIVPPCRSTIAFTIDNPSPLPPATPGRATRPPCRSDRRCAADGLAAIPAAPWSSTDTATPSRDRPGGQTQHAAARRIAERIGGEVLQGLLEAIAIAGDLLGARLDRRLASCTPAGVQRLLVSRATRSNSSATATVAICSDPPPPSSRARSSRSPIIRSSRLVSSLMMPR